MSKRFALIGSAGYIAERHISAIKETGNQLVATCDKSDVMGRIDKYFPECEFFTDTERFYNYLGDVNRNGKKINYLTVCTPNYLHSTHIQMGLLCGMDVICEKPIVFNTEDFLNVNKTAIYTQKNVYAILQLRHHPEIIKLRERIANDNKKHKIFLSYVTRRGKWYAESWKGDEKKSGGLATNIGVHFFDMLGWIFGKAEGGKISNYTNKSVSGVLEFERARVDYFLSIDAADLPPTHDGPAYRRLIIDGETFDFSNGLTDLHTLSYQKILAGEGFGIDDTYEGIKIAEAIRKCNWNG